MIDLQIPNELYTSFNDVTYYDEPHKYYLNGNELISVTTIIHRYQEEFDVEFWSYSKGIEFNLSPEIIKRAWNFINKKGTIKGSAIHNYSENLFQNKIFEYPKQLILNEFGFDPILPEFNITKKHVDKFYSDVHGKLIPIRTEMIIYDRESFIGGMVDMLFYNVKWKCFQIFDWKTNKKFTTENKSKYLLNDLFVLEDTDLTIYSLQLSLYKYIIEKNTGIKLGKSYVVWFSHNNSSYKIIETIDMTYYIKKIIENRISELSIRS